ncbi:MAG: superoxide dismutase family protein [Myxococcota bacterium]
MNWKTPLTIVAFAGLGILGCQRDSGPSDPWTLVELDEPSDSASSPSAHAGLSGPSVIETPAPVIDKRAEALGVALLPATDGKVKSERTRAIEEGASRRGTIEAAAIIASPPGSDVNGSLAFEQTVGEDAVAIDVKLRGLTPGPHALYLHRADDCDSVQTLDHVREASEGDQHRGDDVARLEVGSDGAVEASVTLGGKTLAAGPDSLLGQAVVVDAAPGDGTSRRDAVVCAVILPSGTEVPRR